MNRRMQTSAGGMAYAWPPGVSLGLSFVVIDKGLNPLLIYVAFIASYLFYLAYSSYGTIAARFNGIQSFLMAIVLVGGIITLFNVLGIGSELISGLSEDFELSNATIKMWIFFGCVAIMFLAFLFFSIACMWRSARYGGLLVLPIIGRWAWQSAIKDDTSNTYAPVEEASKGFRG